MVLTGINTYFRFLYALSKKINCGKKNLNQCWSYSWKRVSEVHYRTDLLSITKKLYIFFLPQLIVFR